MLMQQRWNFPVLSEKADYWNKKSVVHYDANNGIGYIIIGLKDDPKHFIFISRWIKSGERQMKALADFCAGLPDFLSRART